jgi:hypothetical protein
VISGSCLGVRQRSRTVAYASDIARRLGAFGREKSPHVTPTRWRFERAIARLCLALKDVNAPSWLAFFRHSRPRLSVGRPSSSTSRAEGFISELLKVHHAITGKQIECMPRPIIELDSLAGHRSDSLHPVKSAHISMRLLSSLSRWRVTSQSLIHKFLMSLLGGCAGWANARSCPPRARQTIMRANQRTLPKFNVLT